jgi:23S rRNA (cytidine1920-2'-O)/16S rRNA (cytidine1409-2'-O)-methyltransferase
MNDNPGYVGGSAGARSDRLRLDTLVSQRGLTRSRAAAQRLIREGKVLVDCKPVLKPSSEVDASARISVDSGDDYVSRGAYKLIGAFDCFGKLGLPSPVGLDCLDIGASTGGFCDVLLRRGATRVIALDVGHGQLDQRIASDPRIIEMSGVNIREVTTQDLPFRPSLVVSDVSFISLTFVIPVITCIVAKPADIVLLVKPQFEVGKSKLGKHGIVTSPDLRENALRTVVDCAEHEGLTVQGTCLSPLVGTHGNMEYLLYATLR